MEVKFGSSNPLFNNPPHPLKGVIVNHSVEASYSRFDCFKPCGAISDIKRVTTVSATGYGSENDVITALFGLINHIESTKYSKPSVLDVLFNGPATIVKFSDDTKAVTKCHKGDKFNGTFGILACAIRKLTRNRGKEVDRFEGVISDLAKHTLMPDDWRKLSDAIGMLADALEVDGVARNAAKHEREYVEPEKHEEPADADSLIDKIIIDRVSEQVSDNEAVQEQVRQTIRDLLDKGEL